MEAKIRAPRKKRRIVLWLAFLGVGMGVTGVLWLYNAGNTSVNESLNTRQKEINRPADAITSKKESNRANQIETSAAKTNDPGRQPSNQEFQVGENSKYMRGKSSSDLSNKIAFLNIEPAIPNTDIFSESAGLESTIEKNDKSFEAISSLPAERFYSIGNRQPDSALFKTVAIKKVEKQLTRLAWIVQLRYGRSWAGADGMQGAASLNFAADPSPSNNPVFGNVQANITGGPFLSAGVLLKKNISSRLKGSAGLQYALYTQKVAVGRKVLVSASSNANFRAIELYEANGGQGSYHNKFQMISVPLALELKPVRSIPLSVQAGVAPGYLVRNKALQYLPGTTYFREVVPAVQRWQLPVHAGLQYRIGATKNWELLAGPFASYHITPMANRKYNDRHLASFGAGIQLQVK
ncbi:hypothetical protein [Cnuella takakiae]|uniref:hypothetical protein n=1 Tax=Cnuella takakiae TaxID=1302690 RepID=UPI0011785010|nr:hypothetical protein [Cnuella takakiae]